MKVFHRVAKFPSLGHFGAQYHHRQPELLVEPNGCWKPTLGPVTFLWCIVFGLYLKFINIGPIATS